MSTDPELESLRCQIDAVDEKILELVTARVRLVLRVGELKRTNGVAVYDPERERSVLDRLICRAVAPLDRDIIQRVFERLIDESRRLELSHVSDSEGRK